MCFDLSRSTKFKPSKRLETKTNAMRDSREETPPYSKLFVLHGKNTTKFDLQEAFEKYGKIQDIWMVRDRESQELKGIFSCQLIYNTVLNVFIILALVDLI